MGVAARGKRTITVEEQPYLWYVALDDDSDYDVLHILSEDKRLILLCPLGTKTAYVISIGRCFQEQPTNGRWNRYLLPFAVPDSITPEFVAHLIVWSTHAHAEPPVVWNGDNGINIPV